jgi:hypothetical protein
MRLHFLLGPLVLAFLASACSSSSGGEPSDAGGTDARDTGAPVDSGRSDAIARDGAADDGSGAEDSPVEAATVCNTLANTASVVDVAQVAQDPPSAQGGTIANGTYLLTAATIYTGPDGPTGNSGTAQVTVLIDGAMVQMVSSGQPPTRTVTLATTGTSFTSTDTCPDTSSATGSYTATPTTLAITLAAGTDEAGARTLVETFTKQ